MDSPFLRAQRYHDQAENLRRLATAEGNSQRHKVLLELADSYDLLSRKLMKEARAALMGQSVH